MGYLRQETFIGKESQQLIEKATVAIIGLGSLGSIESELLTRSGIKKLILIDRDIVEESNVSNQFYSRNDLGIPKVQAIQKRIKQVNKKIQVEAHFIHLAADNINILKADIILDCTDNLETRFLINEYALKNKIPLVYGSAIRDKGYVFVVAEGSPCIECLFQNAQPIETCETSGILNTVATAIASIQVNQAITYLMKKPIEKNLLFVDLATNSIEKIKVKRNQNCLAHSGKFPFLNEKNKGEVIRYCSSGTYLFKKKFNFQETKEKLKKQNIFDFQDGFTFKNITILQNAVLIKAKSEKEARSIFSKYIGD